MSTLTFDLLLHNMQICSGKWQSSSDCSSGNCHRWVHVIYLHSENDVPFRELPQMISSFKELLLMIYILTMMDHSRNCLRWFGFKQWIIIHKITMIWYNCYYLWCLIYFRKLIVCRLLRNSGEGETKKCAGYSTSRYFQSIIWNCNCVSVA